jgi:tRNA dimethylallyltransferase
MKSKPKIITILGPTAIGKSDLAVNISIYLKEKYNIESHIISADSRQVYKHLDLGTGKITDEEMKGVKHHMLDVLNPDQEYSVYQYYQEADKIIQELLNKNILPIICGGTGLYIDALLFENAGAGASQNPELRDELENEDLENLQNKLKVLSQKYQADIENIDIKNKRRVIRAIEILTELKTIPEKKYIDKYDNLIIGLDTDYEFLQNRIKIRIDKRLKIGMIEEVENLLKENKINHPKLQKLGLEYNFISDYLTGILTMEEFKEKLYFAICHYAKRQKTWFKNSKNLNNNDNHIDWFDIQDVGFEKDVLKKVTTFINSSI